MNIPIVDLHEDVSSYYASYGMSSYALDRFDKDLEGREVDLPKYERGNIRLVFASIYPAWGGLDDDGNPSIAFPVDQLSLFYHYRVYYKLARVYGVEIVEGSRRARSLVESGKWRMGIIIHLEGADPLLDPDDLELHYKLGLRSLGLTWNRGNKYAASCMSKRDYGLTDEGYMLVEAANRLGVIIDLAHASSNTIVEVAEASKKPVIISHTGVRWRVDTPRNVGLRELEAVHRSGGVVGVTLLPKLVASRTPTLEDVSSTILEIIELFNSSLPAIGTDYLGMPGMKPPRGLETIDKLQVLLEKLAEKGLGEGDLERIAYQNALRVIEDVLE